MMSEYDLSDIDRRVSRLIRLAVIAEADYAKARIRVRIGKVITNWLPWITQRAGADLDYWAPSVDEQVVVLAPDGDFSNAVVLGSIYQAKHPAPVQTPMIRMTRMRDGATLHYNSETSELTITLPGTAEVEIVGNVSLKVQGSMSAAVTGDATVTARGISLNDGSPVVTTGHICHFTGNPHGDGSSTVRAGK